MIKHIMSGMIISTSRANNTQWLLHFVSQKDTQHLACSPPSKLLSHNITQRPPLSSLVRLTRQNTCSKPLAPTAFPLPLGIQACAQPFKAPCIALLLANKPPRNTPAGCARQHVAAVCSADAPAHGGCKQRSRKLRESELERGEIGKRF